MAKKLKSLLVANRGEIAVRVIRVCREMGIRSVAVYSEADARSLHVWLADEAVLIGPPPATESYLRSDRVIAAAKETRCNAIHPGYGFLAENAGFAEAVTAAGLIFVGPSADAIRKMGSKTEARTIAQQAGVPVVPGFQDSQQDDELIQAAQHIGFPVLIKASAGGGGRGMRVVQSADEFSDALASARREALKAFGDDRVYVEKLIANPRHIEVQVLGDKFGNIMHLFERECSIQRRYQKIIEETPSPFLDDEQCKCLTEMAVTLVRAVNYISAGTVEFIADAQRNVYFLEMNTRLQVEHSITEMVTGVDLVKAQIDIAAGAPLTQRVGVRGHAIECRITAEDPANDFLPTTGRITRIAEPVGPGVRVDSGITDHSEVTPYYDSLLAKLIVHGETRGDAIRRMDAALRDYAIEGVTTNIAFLCDVINHPAFRRGDTTTDFIERYFSAWPLTQAEYEDSSLKPGQRTAWNPWRQRNRFRVGAPPLSEVTAERRQASRPHQPYSVATSNRIEAPMPGLIVDVLVKEGNEVARGATLVILEAMKMETRLTAPVTATVKRVHCTRGQTVERGKVLVELE